MGISILYAYAHIFICYVGFERGFSEFVPISVHAYKDVLAFLLCHSMLLLYFDDESL